MSAPPDAEILDAIVEVARRELRHEKPLTAEMRLVEDLGLDSLKLLMLAVEVENRFLVRLDDNDDEDRIRTVGDLVAAVRERL